MNVKSKGGYTAAFGAVAAGWVIFTWPWLSGKFTIPYDAKAHFQAQLQFLANALHSGQSPFWTPNVFTGSPQIADPQSLIFSPAALLAYFEPAPSFRELDMFCFGLVAMAALSVIMLFKDRGWHPAGAALAALAVAFGGSAYWRIQHIKQIESFAFFILCLALLARALERKSLLYGFLAGFAGAMLVIEPGQVAMLGCYVLIGYVAHHWLSSPNRVEAIKASIKPLAIGGAVAALMATVPILLSYLFVQSSNRPDIPFAEAGRGALHPASLLTAAVSDLYSVRSNLPYWGPASSDWRASWLSISENMGQLYIGALPIFLILAVGIVRGGLWSKEIRFFGLAALFLLTYALGWYTPVFRLLYDYLPGVDLFRRPADATYAFCAMLAILSGYLLHRLLSGSLPPASRWQGIIGIAVIAALLLTCAGVAAAHHHMDVATMPILLAAAFFASAFGLVYGLTKLSPQRGVWITLAIAAFATFDLSVNNGPSRSTAQPTGNYDALRVDTKNETIAFLKARLAGQPGSPTRDRAEIVGLGFEWPNIALIHGFDHVLGYNPVRLGDTFWTIGATETVAEARQRVFTPLFPSYRSQLADLLGLRYAVLSNPIEQIDKRFKPGDLNLVATTKEAYIYENPRALPRVLFASGWLPADFKKMTLDGLWPDFDPRRTILLEKAPEEIKMASGPGAAQTEAKVVLRTYVNTKVEIEVETQAPGFVVLNDIWHPWWFASVDGKPATILRTNVLFRAVQVPAGKHSVSFEFRPVTGAVQEILASLDKKLKRTEPAGEDITSQGQASVQAMPSIPGTVQQMPR
jgi:hypothetical protein